MEKLLIVSSLNKDILPPSIKSDFNTMTTSSHNEARKLSLLNNYDLIIINLPNNSGINLATELVKNTFSQIILIVSNDIYDFTYSLEELGIIVITKPINMILFKQIINIAKANNARLRSIQKLNIKLSNQIKDIKLINRAKWILINKSNMDENFAHKYIEKLAMSKRQSKREIAETIITSYEN